MISQTKPTRTHLKFTCSFLYAVIYKDVQLAAFLYIYILLNNLSDVLHCIKKCYFLFFFVFALASECVDASFYLKFSISGASVCGRSGKKANWLISTNIIRRMRMRSWGEATFSKCFTEGFCSNLRQTFKNDPCWCSGPKYHHCTCNTVLFVCGRWSPGDLDLTNQFHFRNNGDWIR